MRRERDYLQVSTLSQIFSLQNKTILCFCFVTFLNFSLRQYEEKIHSLKTSFGKEKASKKKMEERLLKLQEEKNKQLMTVDEKKESAMAEAVASPEVSQRYVFI